MPTECKILDQIIICIIEMFNLPKLASAHQASGSTESEEEKDILVPSTLFSKWLFLTMTNV